MEYTILAFFIVIWVSINYLALKAKNKKIIDMSLFGHFISLLLFNIIVWMLTVIHEPLNTEQWSAAFLSNIIIIFAPITANLLLRYRSLYVDNRKFKRASWISALCISFLSIMLLLGAQGAFVAPTVCAVRYYSSLAPILITSGIGINARDSGTITPLGAAIDNNDIVNAKLLLLHGANVNARYFGETPVKVFEFKGPVTGVQTVILDNGETLLMRAAKKSDKVMVDLLISNGADVNVQDYRNKSATDFACTFGNLSALQTLLANGGSLSTESKNSGLNYAVSSYKEKLKKIELISFLLANGADINAKSREITPLVIAASGNNNNDIDVMQLLIANGADVNAGEHKSTALMRAMLRKNDTLAVVSLLLNAGADIRAVDSEGGTALLWATGTSTEIVKLLLDRGSDVNEQDKYGDTALIRAASKNRQDIATFLLDKGANVNAQGRRGKTPLIYFASSGSPEMTLKILQLGAEPNTKDSSGRTALDYAKKTYSQCVSYLQQYGAK